MRTRAAVEHDDRPRPTKESDAMTSPMGTTDPITNDGTSTAEASGPTSAAAAALQGATHHGEGETATNAAAAKARELAQKAQETAKTRARSTVDSGRTRAAETIETVAQTLRGSTDQLREQEHPEIGRYIAVAADRMESLANYLRNTETDELVRRAESYARRQPALFLGGAFVVGLLGARFLKSSRRAQVGNGAHALHDTHEHEVGIATFDERAGGMGAGAAFASTGATFDAGADFPDPDANATGQTSYDAGAGMTGGSPAVSGGPDGAGTGTMHTSDTIADLDASRPSGLDDPDTRA
ncbi:MAG: hypothetical protein MUF21_04505 [Gemmatimonadaceae bacterium]|nr:hypothetical protein [Gemmatimonadaceae bacterium]MCU0625738.1 hypothetical protein [Gemmatimonadaceae bacterium]